MSKTIKLATHQYDGKRIQEFLAGRDEIDGLSEAGGSRCAGLEADDPLFARH